MSYFGIPIRNGLPIGLGSVAPLASGGGSPFSPLSLFAGGAPGAWYDPSDYGATGTLFQDSAGTTPVTAVEQPVGLMLDKSQGLVLGSELNTVPDNWTVQPGWINGGGGSYSGTNNSGFYKSLAATPGSTYYEVSLTVSNYVSGTVTVALRGNVATVGTGNGTKTIRLFAGGTGDSNFYIYGTGTLNCTISGVSIKAVAGNHAFQATSASRPVLSARYNLLTKTEQFDDAAWSKASVTAANTNETTDPFGGNTADKVTCTSTVNTAHIRQDVSNVSGYSYSFYAKAGTSNFACFTTNTNATYANFNLSTGAVSSSAGCTAAITLIGNGWYRCVITNAQSGIYFMILGKDADPAAQPYGNGNWTSGNYIYTWGADLRVANNGITQPAYQRVNTATDYATTGFLPYLKFDGVDDSLSTNSISFTSTDKMSVFAGVRKLVDTFQMYCELSTSATANNGTFLFYGGGTGTQQWLSKGTVVVDVGSTPITAPITQVLTGVASISTDVATLRINGTQAATSAADQGTGNYGNYPLFIGSRNNASQRFNGQMYSMIIVGKSVTAGELSSTETYVATKTGVTL